MPKRLYKTTFRVDAAEVQGEGAYVDFRRLTWAQFQPLINEKKDQARKRVEMTVAGWNWVDDDGNELPNPHEHPEVLDLLTEQEITFLITRSVQGPDKEQEKNSEPPSSITPG